MFHGKLLNNFYTVNLCLQKFSVIHGLLISCNTQNYKVLQDRRPAGILFAFKNIIYNILF